MSDSESLHESYRQSLRELWCIVAAWGVFALWNITAGALLAFALPEPGKGMATILGMPKWIFVVVLFPWLLGNVFSIWFALRFMKDTPLGEALETRELREP